MSVAAVGHPICVFVFPGVVKVTAEGLPDCREMTLVARTRLDKDLWLRPRAATAQAVKHLPVSAWLVPDDILCDSEIDQGVRPSGPCATSPPASSIMAVCPNERASQSHVVRRSPAASAG